MLVSSVVQHLCVKGTRIESKLTRGYLNQVFTLFLSSVRRIVTERVVGYNRLPSHALQLKGTEEECVKSVFSLLSKNESRLIK